MATPGASGDSGLRLSERVRALDAEVRGTRPGLCAERALLVTRYFRGEADRRAPAVEQRAGALAYLLRHKQARIHPGELLVGCFTSRRVGAGVYPELHGVFMLEDLLRVERRRVNPFEVDEGDRRRLLREVVPYWVTRCMPMRAFPLLRQLAFLADQHAPTAYLVNESGGISHFVPDYAGLVERGVASYRDEARRRLADLPRGAPTAPFFRAVVGVCDGLEAFAASYQDAALRLAALEADAARRRELEAIAECCGRVPRLPARTFREALQAILFAQIALNLESLDNSVCPGRLDQILFPFYARETAAGTLGPATAFELLGCFAVKLCELLPMFSRRVTRFHGGLFNGQVVVVGGLDRDGRDATNEVTLLFLELMDRLRTRQPNYHARVHAGSPAAYRRRIAAALADGAVSPASTRSPPTWRSARSSGPSPPGAAPASPSRRASRRATAATAPAPRPPCSPRPGCPSPAPRTG